MHERAARPDDYDAWVGFWREIIVAGPPPTRERWVEHLMRYTMFLEDDGVLAAYNLSYPFGARGDVRQLAVAPAFRRRGVGIQLMAAVAAKLRAAGCTEWRLEVRADNAAAIALYRSAGMQPLRDVHSVVMAREACERFAASRSMRHAAIAVIPADDAALEATFDFGTGQLQRWRTFRADCPIVRIGFDAMVQINRAMAPTHGLLFPFIAPDADVAAHLMAEALPDMPAIYEISLTQPAIYEALLAAGAEPDERYIEFSGSLDAAPSRATTGS